MGEQRDWGGRNCKRNSMQICFGNEQNSLKLRGFPEIGKAEKSHQMTQILTGVEGVIQENTLNTGKDFGRFLHYFISFEFIFK